MPPPPNCAEKAESLIFTSATVSKIGVLMTLLLMGELVDAPSRRALENGILPLTDTCPALGLALLVPLPRVPGSITRNDCQSGVLPVCGRFLRASWFIVWEISAVVVSNRGAASVCTTTCWFDCPRLN